MPPINPAARADRVVVLMWHDVVASRKLVWFDTPVAQLRAQFSELRRRHAHPITLQLLEQHLAQGVPVPPRSVLLTFDDNYAGGYRYAFPMLKEFGYPAAFFVHTDYVGVQTDKGHNTWDQLREIAATPGFAVGSQTCSHPAYITTLDDNALHHEVEDSRSTLEAQLKMPVRAFVYPEGHYNARAAKAVAAAGYTLGFMEDHGYAGSSRNLVLVKRFSTHRRWADAMQALGKP